MHDEISQYIGNLVTFIKKVLAGPHKHDKKFRVFPIIAPQLIVVVVVGGGQITYSPPSPSQLSGEITTAPPNHGRYTNMGGLYFHGGL